VISHKEMENHKPATASGEGVLERPGRLTSVMVKMYNLKNDLASRGGRAGPQIDISDPSTSPEMEHALNALLNNSGAFLPGAAAKAASSMPPLPPAGASPPAARRGGPPVISPHQLSRKHSSLGESEFFAEHVVRSIRTVHTATYLEKLRSTVQSVTSPKPDGAYQLTRCLSKTYGDTWTSERSLHAAVVATMCVCSGIRHVVKQRYKNCFCAVRPPGHHAGSGGATHSCNQRQDLAGEMTHSCGQGFCLLNNVAVGARYALDSHPQLIKRITIFDWDLHHGNGTEEIVAGDSRIQYLSLHRAGPGFYPGYQLLLPAPLLLLALPLLLLLAADGCASAPAGPSAAPAADGSPSAVVSD